MKNPTIFAQKCDVIPKLLWYIKPPERRRLYRRILLTNYGVFVIRSPNSKTFHFFVGEVPTKSTRDFCVFCQCPSHLNPSPQLSTAEQKTLESLSCGWRLQEAWKQGCSSWRSHWRCFRLFSDHYSAPKSITLDQLGSSCNPKPKTDEKFNHFLGLKQTRSMVLEYLPLFIHEKNGTWRFFSEMDVLDAYWKQANAYMFTYNGWVSGRLDKPRSTGKSSCFHWQFGSKSTRLRHTQLVGGWATPLKNMGSSVGMMIPKIWTNKKWSKPPTSQIIGYKFHEIYIYLIYLNIPILSKP